MDANSRVVSGGAAFGASRISDSLRRSDDPAAGDMPRTHRDCTQQRAEAASARETHCAYPERAERATAELTIAGGPKVRIISLRQRVSDEPWAADQGHSNVPRGASPFLALTKPSGKVPETHSVGSICDHDFGVFTVTNIATENTDAVPPAHPVPRMPTAADQGFRRCRGPRVPLTRLAPLAAWQSLCTGHVDASLENSVALAFTDGGRPSGGSRYFRQPCVGALASLPRQRCLLVTRRMRFTLG
jgi:hypothetical protein